MLKQVQYGEEEGRLRTALSSEVRSRSPSEGIAILTYNVPQLWAAIKGTGLVLVDQNDWSPAMNCDLRKDLQPHGPTAAASLPPAMVEETGWDILLVLHSDRRHELSLDKLASLASVSQTVMHRWLAGLEQRQLIAGAKDSFTGELRAVLTSAGRELLDRYLSATSDLQCSTPH